jgi:hypothetical protein
VTSEQKSNIANVVSVDPDFPVVNREQAVQFLELARDRLIECVSWVRILIDECVNPRLRQAFQSMKS